MAMNNNGKWHKRIIVCCDGTWLNSDSGYDEKENVLKVPSNVTRFARALRSADKRGGGDGVPQIVYYQAGVGTKGIMDKLSGGLSGGGLDENVREAYAFIAKNWSKGDEIFLVGFSRGAFTARSIAGFISNVGLLTNAGMEHFYRIFKDYENMKEKDYKNPVPGLKVPAEFLPLADHQKEYFEFLKTGPKGSTEKWISLTSGEIPEIQAVGVWDTVGSLGIPGIFALDQLKRTIGMTVPRDELRFYDTNLAPNVLNAFQALALDEMRYSFEPAVWEKPAGMTTKLKQVWFPGVHSNIGGGMQDQELSNITLAWMMSQMDPFLDFDAEYINIQFSGIPTTPNPDAKRKTPSAWSLGNIDTSHNNMIYKIAGDHMVRTPGQYLEINIDTGYPKVDTNKKPIPLFNTQERIHSSVRIRLVRHGLGINDNKSGYEAEALTPHKMMNFRGAARHGWKVEKVEGPDDVQAAEALQVDFPGEEKAIFLWRPTGGKEDVGQKVMIEDVLGKWERVLLEREPGALSEFWNQLPQVFS